MAFDRNSVKVELNLIWAKRKKERERERERLNFDDGPTFCESEMVRKKSSGPKRVFLIIIG